MATDDEYMAFLDKANRDPSEGYAQAATTTGGGSGGGAELKATDAGVEVPPALAAAARGVVYVSDADEEFVPVALRFAGETLPDEGGFPPPFFFLLLLL